MSRRTPSFHPDIPKDPVCPPADAKPSKVLLYRGVREMPLDENKDFTSHAELKRRNCNPKDCTHWGLSVWLTAEAVNHAREAIPFLKNWHIAAGTVDADDGVLMATPSEAQPDHYTFWKYKDRKIVDKFKIVMPPVPAS